MPDNLNTTIHSPSLKLQWLVTVRSRVILFSDDVCFLFCFAIFVRIGTKSFLVLAQSSKRKIESTVPFRFVIFSETVLGTASG